MEEELGLCTRMQPSAQGCSPRSWKAGTTQAEKP